MNVVSGFWLIFSVLSIVQCNDNKYFRDRTKGKENYNDTQFSTLRVFIAEYEPYIYQEKGVGTRYGIEYFLVKTIAEIINSTVSVQLSNRENLLKRWEPVSRYNDFKFVIFSNFYALFFLQQ